MLTLLTYTIPKSSANSGGGANFYVNIVNITVPTHRLEAAPSLDVNIVNALPTTEALVNIINKIPAESPIFEESILLTKKGIRPGILSHNL